MVSFVCVKRGWDGGQPYHKVWQDVFGFLISREIFEKYKRKNKEYGSFFVFAES
jgi:hypothetical protein